MKTRLIFVLFQLAPLVAFGQMMEANILERGPHHRVVQSSRSRSDGSQDPTAAGSSYVELATGMHYLENGQWAESRELIEVSPHGASARRGAHKVAFAANLNSAWAIDLHTADGKRFRSHVLGLAYTDAASGKSVLIAEVKDSIGQIAGAHQNEVLYQDAFTDFAGDVRYTYTLAGFEQDIILRQRPPSPEDYGLNPETTRLEVFTEFLEPPVPNKSRRVVSHEADPERRRAMADPDFTDELLEFGETQIGSGRAFSLGNQGGVDDPGASVPVGKSWERIDGRDFLIEKVEYLLVKAQMDALPRAALPAKAKWDRRSNLAAQREMMARIFPPAPKPAQESASPMRMASLPVKEHPGFVVDYAISSTGGTLDTVFRSDTTYYITGSLNLRGLTTLEGGTVIKFSKPSSPSAPLQITGANARIQCLAGPYRPVILTAKDDNSVGETIRGSTGTPIGTYASCALSIDYNSSLMAADLSNLRIRYSKVGLHFNGGTRHVVRHSQFLNCETAVELDGAATECHFGNLLVCNSPNYFSSSCAVKGSQYCKAHLVNVTFERVINLQQGYVTLYLTNCLLANVTTPGTYHGQPNFTVTNPGTEFKILGAGAHYLSENSYQDRGTPLIDPGLLNDLRQRTTTAPEEKTGDFTGTRTIILEPSPRVRRAATGCDPGYHYDPVDYVWSGRNLSCPLLLTNGVAVAIYGATGTTLQSGAQFISEGSPTRMNRLVRYNAVQENPSWGSSASIMSLIDTASGILPVRPDIRLSFTELSFLADSPSKRRIVNSGSYNYNLSLNDCQLRNPCVYLFNSDGSQTTRIALTNNLVERPFMELYQGYYGAVYALHLQLRNNTFLGGSVRLTYLNTYTSWGIYDNFFDTVNLTADVRDAYAFPLPNSNNGYLSATQLAGSNPRNSNKTVSTRDYQNGHLGTYYYPTTADGNNLAILINAGSHTAAEAGLYHHTVRADQQKEAGVNPRVAIGFHYVAIENGEPSDSDGDGHPDYLENRDGEGTHVVPDSLNPEVILTAGPICYLTNSSAISLDALAIVKDNRRDENFARGELSVAIATGGQSGDRIFVQDRPSGPISVASAGGGGSYSVKYNGTVIGSFDLPGSQANPLLIRLNANARLDGVQALVRAITFEHHSVAPAIASRTLRVILKDGNNGTSAPGIKVIDPCFVSAGPEQWAMLRCDSPTSSGLVEIATPFSQSLGIDYLEPSRRIVVGSHNSPTPAIALISADGSQSQFSSYNDKGQQELVIATARDEGGGLSRGGFEAGTLFVGNQRAGEIVRIHPDGTSEDPWIKLPEESGYFEGGLHLDRTGCFDGDLIAITTSGKVWRIKPADHADSPPAAPFATILDGDGASVRLEGVTTIPDDILRYGDWAGKILVGAGDLGKIYHIDRNGNVRLTPALDFGTPQQPQERLGDLDVIPANENFFGTDWQNEKLWGAAAAAFDGMVGDVLVTETTSGFLWRVHWDGASKAFLKERILQEAVTRSFEQVAFAPAGIAPMAPVSVVGLRGKVFTDASCVVAAGRTIVSWSLVSAPAGASVKITNPRELVTSARLDRSGDYRFRLSLNHCRGVVHDDVVVHVRCNLPPVVKAAPLSAVPFPGPAQLGGTVADVDSSALTIRWSKVAGPGAVTFRGGRNTPIGTAQFSLPGVYTLRLSASDGLASAFDELIVKVVKANEAPVVSAGPDNVIALPEMAYLAGGATDDNVPSGDPLSVTWSKLSGPGSVAFDTEHSLETFASFDQPGTYQLKMEASDGALSSFDTVQVIVLPSKGVRAFRNLAVVTAGLGGMRGASRGEGGESRSLRPGTGTLQLEGVSGDVKQAYLYWHGPTDSVDPEANSEVLVNGRFVKGINLGLAHNNGWRYGSHPFANSQAYRGDVTALVRAFGNGAYVLTNFVKGREIEVNGASMVVLFDDGNPNAGDVILADGNDSNDRAEFYFDSEVNSLAIAGNGLFVGGAFGSPNAIGRNRIARLKSDGSLDQTFRPVSGVNGESSVVYAVAVQPDGKWIVAGEFDSVEGQVRKRVARFNANGSLDKGFDPGAGPNAPVRALALRPDGKLIIVGEFTSFGLITRHRIALLNPDGSLDPVFNPDADGPVYSVVSRPNGQMLVGGSFTKLNDIGHSGIGRLHEDGTVDGTFNPSVPDVRAIAVQADGRILLGGGFPPLYDSGPSGIARLSGDGTVDTTFASGQLGPDNLVTSLARTADDKIIVAGRFSAVHGSSRKRIARLNSAGQLDDPPSGKFAEDFQSAYDVEEIRAIAIQADGRLVLGGKFSPSESSTVAHSHLARLDADGRLDPEFKPTDGGWNLSIPGINYSSGEVSVELHVSDGQPSAFVQGTFSCRSDPIVKVNGHLFLESVDMGYLGNQIFAGVSVPWAYHEPSLGFGLWDITRPKLVPPSWMGQGANQSFALTAARSGNCWSSDNLSLVLAILRLPLDSAPQSIVTSHRMFSADLPPVARNDAVVLSRGLGRTLINVLGNDSSAHSDLLVIESVTPAAQGQVQIVHNGSVLLYTSPANAARTTDAFSYTIIDRNGNTASARVEVSIEGSGDAIPLSFGQTITGNLEVSDDRTTVRGGGQSADFYHFTGTVGDHIHVTLGARAFPGHLYVRDPLGQLMDSASHDPAQSSPNGSVSMETFLPSTGAYAIEVTSHDVGESGPYTLELGFAPIHAALIEVSLDGQIIENGLPVDLGIVLSGQTKTFLFRNVGDEDAASLHVHGGFNGSGSVDPQVIDLLPRGASRTVTLTLDNHPGSGWVEGDLGSGPIDIKLIGYLNPGNSPLLTIVSPSDGAALPYPSNISLAVEIEDYELVPDVMELFAVGPAGVTKIGETFESFGSLSSVLWNNPFPGTYTIRAVARFGSETSASAPITLTITAPSPNHLPVAANDRFSLPANSPPRLLPLLANDSDADGDPLVITQVDHASAKRVTITPNKDAIIYTPEPGAFGFDKFSYTISDGRGGTARAQVEVVSEYLGVQVIAAPAFDRLQPIPIEVEAVSSRGAIARIELFVKGQGAIRKFHESSAVPTNVTWTPSQAGYYTFTAVAVDETGQRVESAPAIVKMGNPNIQPPSAEISNLVDDQLLRVPLFDLRGVADHSQASLGVSYQLTLHRFDSGQVARVRTLLPEGGDAEDFVEGRISANPSLGSGSFGTLDFSTLRNGPYLLRLRVRAGAVERETEVRFILENQVKLGQFKFSEVDLVVPAPGIPLTVVRSYDSQNPAFGDFGYGWSFSVNDLDVELDEQREETPAKTGAVDNSNDPNDTFSMRIGGGRNVTLTLPDGRRTTFAFVLAPAHDALGVSSFSLEARWKAAPGVSATLVSMDNNLLNYIPWQNQIDPFWQAGPDTPMDYFDFSGFWLTNHDGTVFEITRTASQVFELPSDGNQIRNVRAYDKPKLTRILQRSGDQILIGNSRIEHRDAQQTVTRSISFDRDANGCITALYDPESGNGGPAVIKYEYDPLTTNLTKVLRLKDRAGGQYETTTYQYASDVFPHHLTGILDSRNVPVLKSIYDPQGRLIRTENDRQAGVSFNHDIVGRREIITGPQDEKSIHEYDSRGNVTRSLDGSGQVIARAYDGNDRLTSETDRLGHTVRHEYDGNGNRTKIIDALGHESAFTYNRFGQMLTSQDARGHGVTNVYDNATGRLLHTTNALGQVASHTYNSRGLLKTSTDPVGTVTDHEYDALGNLLLVKTLNPASPQGYPLSWAGYVYDANGNRRAETMHRLLDGADSTITTMFVYDAQNRLQSTLRDVGGLNLVTGTTYNEIGKTAATTDALGRETRFQYDSRGNLVQTVHPDGTITRSVYDPNNRLAYAQVLHLPPGTPANPNSAESVAHGSHHVYDPAGRLVRTERLRDIVIGLDCDGPCETSFVRAGPAVRDPEAYSNILVSATQTLYDAGGRVAASIDARGFTTRYEYDGAGRRTKVINALDEVTTFGYDAAGNQIWIEDALGRRTDYEYDSLNRRVTTIFPATQPGGARAVARTGYDASGLRTAETNELGIVSRFGYDQLGRLLAVTNAWNTDDATWVTYAYDELGNQLTQTDALNRTTTFEYDALGRRTKRTLPGGLFESLTYNPVGNLVQRTHFEASRPPINYSYDAADRLISKSGGQAVLLSYTYSPEGHRATMTDALGQTFYTYDAANRLVRKSVPLLGNSGRVLSYTYDPNGNVSSIKAFDGSYEADVTTHLRYDYDALNRLKNTVVADPSIQAPKVAATYDYDALGNVAEVQYSNGVKHGYSYDRRNRLTKVAVTAAAVLLAQFAYDVDAVGRKTTLEETLSGQQSTYRWTYDNLSRLKSESIQASPGSSASVAGSLSYVYDRVGNRTERTGTLGPVTAQRQRFDQRDQLDNDDDPITASKWFDANGNTTNFVGKICEYDLENRLIGVNGGQVQMAYDGDGHRVRKTGPAIGGGSKTTWYLVDDLNPTGYAQVLEEWETSNTEPPGLVRRFTYGLDLVSARDSSTSYPESPTHYYGYDGHGSVRFLTGEAGPAVTDTYTYDAYGVLIAQSPADPNARTPNAYLYVGEQWDSDLGFYYNRARYLDPNLGRFWTMDTFEGDESDPLSLHKYLYAHDTPLNLTDPSGYDANFTLVGQTTTQGMNLNLHAIGAGTEAAFAHSVRVSLLFKFGAYAVLGTTIAGNVALVTDAILKTQPKTLDFRPAPTFDEDEEPSGDLIIHRMGGRSNLSLGPRDRPLDPPGFSVLIGGTPEEAAFQMRAAFPTMSRILTESRTVASAKISSIRAAGFDVIAKPSFRLPNHCRLVHQSGAASPFDGFASRQVLSSAFTEMHVP